MTSRLWPHRPLFRRIYFHGLMLVVLVAVVIAAAVASMGREQLSLSHRRIGEYAAWRVDHWRSQPEQLAQELRRAREEFGARITVWTLNSSIIASNVEPPLPPLNSNDLARLGDGAFLVRGRHQTLAAKVPGEPPAYVLLSGPLHVVSPMRIAILVAVVLLVLAIGSIPLAHGIAAPLERLTAAARALGSGNLSSRAGLARRKDEVGELAVAFDEMADRLEKLVRSERELLANLSHELRTPLARMRVALDLAAEGDLIRARRYLSEIGIDLSELDQLVGDVLTISRFDLAADHGGELPLRRETVDAGDLLREVADRFETAHPDRTLELELAQPLPVIDADPALLRRAIENLLDNARKYSDPGQPVTLSAHARDDALVVEVRDRGIGIDPDDLPRLFTPFFRSDRSRTRGTGGIGLGLVLARRIIEAHGGTIAAQSQPGEGTALSFTVPNPGAALH